MPRLPPIPSYTPGAAPQTGQQQRETLLYITPHTAHRQRPHERTGAAHLHSISPDTIHHGSREPPTLDMWIGLTADAEAPRTPHRPDQPAHTGHRPRRPGRPIAGLRTPRRPGGRTGSSNAHNATRDATRTDGRPGRRPGNHQKTATSRDAAIIQIYQNFLVKPP